MRLTYLVVPRFVPDYTALSELALQPPELSEVVSRSILLARHRETLTIC